MTRWQADDWRRRMSFTERLQELGYSSYEAYLQSAHWTDLKKRYFASRLPKTCLVCGSSHVQMHHVTYKRIGTEWLNDLVPLCDLHHGQVHSSLKESGRSLRNSFRTIRRLKKNNPI